MAKRILTFDEAERRLRKLLIEEGYAQPDCVRRGPAPHELTFLWEDGDHEITMDLAEFPEQPPPPPAVPTAIETEAQMRTLLSNGDVRQPDEVRDGPGVGEVSCLWHAEKFVAIVEGADEPFQAF